MATLLPSLQNSGISNDPQVLTVLCLECLHNAPVIRLPAQGSYHIMLGLQPVAAIVAWFWHGHIRRPDIRHPGLLWRLWPHQEGEHQWLSICFFLDLVRNTLDQNPVHMHVCVHKYTVRKLKKKKVHKK